MIFSGRSFFLFRTLMFMRNQKPGKQETPPFLPSYSLFDSWYPLECKPGQKKTDYRGELEVKIGFTVRASESVGGSVADLTKKNKGSISSLNKVAGNIGGSLLSLGGKEKKNFKKIAASVTKKVEKVGGKAKKSVSSLKLVSGEKKESISC